MDVKRVLIFCLFFLVVLHELEAAEINLEGEWLFKTGDDSAWAKKDFNDKDWKAIQVPSTWEKQGYPDYDGIAWYRKHFTIPEELSGKDLNLIMGAIDDEDITYVNGIEIGSIKQYNAKREYLLKLTILNAGKDNVIAVRVNDTGGGGGIWKRPVVMAPPKFENIFNVEREYIPPKEGDFGQIKLKFNNISVSLLKDIKIEYKVLDYFDKEIASGEEIISVPGNGTASKAIKILQGKNKNFKLHLEITRSDGEKILYSRRVLTGVKDPRTDHVWLHVDGRYIKTSPYADPANQIFVAAGVAKRYLPSGPDDDVINWMLDRHCNCIRYDIYAYKSFNFDITNDIIDEKFNPFVQACKANELYIYFDCHEYFHQFLEKDDWLPDGPLWDDVIFQKWNDFWVTMAKYYKDEPWVMGYELCNEPVNVTAKKSREAHMKCIKAIRQVDTRHIVLLGNNNYTHTSNMQEVWTPVKFRPDEPFNQVVFAFHEYTNADNPDVTAPIIDYIQNKYDVPVFCTEFGDASTVRGLTEEMKRRFESDMFAMFKPRGIGWSIWVLDGMYPNFSLPYENIWVPAAKNQALPIPQLGTALPKATMILCSVSPDNTVSFGETVTVNAYLCDTARWTVNTATNKVKFEVISKKEGIAKIEGPKSVTAKNGIVTIKLKAGSSKGKVTLKASSEGLTPFETIVRVVKRKK